MKIKTVSVGSTYFTCLFKSGFRHLIYISSLTLINLGQNVPIFNSGSRIVINHFFLKSCSLQNIKTEISLLSENRVVFYFRNQMYYLRWRRSSARREYLSFPRHFISCFRWQFSISNFLVYVWSVGYKKKSNDINPKSCSFHIMFIKTMKIIQNRWTRYYFYVTSLL